MWKYPGDLEKPFSMKNHIYHPFWTYRLPKYTWSHMLQNGENHDFGNFEAYVTLYILADYMSRRGDKCDFSLKMVSLSPQDTSTYLG